MYLISSIVSRRRKSIRLVRRRETLNRIPHHNKRMKVVRVFRTLHPLIRRFGNFSKNNLHIIDIYYLKLIYLGGNAKEDKEENKEA